MKKAENHHAFVQLLAVILAMTMVLLSGCGSAPAATSTPAAETASPTAQTETAEPKYGGTLKLGEMKANGATMWKELGCPQYKCDLHDRMRFMPAVESLGRVMYDETYSPWLAESWDVDREANTITLHLRQGIKFTDGTDFNAEAVVWNLELYQELQRSFVISYDSFEALDEYTVKCNVDTWRLSTEDELLSTYMISPSYYEAVGGYENLAFDNCGTGPFILESADTSSIVYTRNPDYWGKDENGNQLPYLDGLEFTIFEDVNTLGTALESGKIDVALTYNNFANIMNLTASGELQCSPVVSTCPFGQVYCLAFPDDLDESQSPFADVRVRQAAAYAIDDVAMAYGISSGLFEGCTELAYEGSSMWSDGEVEGYPYNPEKARELLAEAGYSDGCPVKFYGVATNTRDTIIVSYLEEAGFEVEFVPSSSDNSRIGCSDPAQGAMITYGQLDWVGNGYSLFGETPVFFQDRWPEQREKIVELYNTAMSCETLDEAREYVIELEKYVIDENCLLVPLVRYFAPIVYTSDLYGAGFQENRVNRWDPESAWLDR